MSDRPARPVLKWAGGKTQLLPEILKRLPGAIETYYEPFVGGAAVFFALAAQGRFKRAVLSDSNPELVGLYRALQRDVDGVIRALGKYRYDESEYYRVRDSALPRSPAARAARLIYLNKTGYNGLYRVNRAGQFNVPFGRYRNPTICDADNLRAAARALRTAEVRVADFARVSRAARAGDAVYFDPPYLPISKTASFTAYDRHAFALL
ncbi:MAG TPA: Dam family site-specific DNA-(adenine-N6)-methyltransferase, partial [Polyangiaceae bacterium]|nr:Dam family site-specific DNA-(adenine-N6)-methyltransferase [Polyangiaceae bacterium]